MHVPSKLDQTNQEVLVNEYEESHKNKGEDDPICFGDGCHPQCNSIPASDRVRRGVEKELKSNCGRGRMNINGAVDIDTLKTVTNFSDSINSQSTFCLFKKLEAKNPDAKAIHFIVDNAMFYKSQWGKEEWQDSRGVLRYDFFKPNF